MTSAIPKVNVKQKLNLLTKIVSKKVTIKQKLYLQGHPESGKSKLKREKVIMITLKRKLKYKLRIKEKSQN